tara:strand:- start:2993 stop:3772 length:780 start_codon:yes stop_codon:yes gene_type:complete
MEKEKKECHNFKDDVNNLKTRLNMNSVYGSNNLQEWLIDQLDIKSNDSILDIGCGEGKYLNAISKLTSNKCIGIDYDKEMIDKSIETYASNQGVAFFNHSMDELDSDNCPINGQKFDIIYSAYAFYYSKDSFKLLDVLKNYLTPTGRIVIVGPYADNNKDWFTFLNQFVQLPDSIMESSYKFMADVYSYAEKEFSEAYHREFINTITMPTYDDLKMYWEANIYYDEKYDSQFNICALDWFSNNNTFSYDKVARLVSMSK